MFNQKQMSFEFIASTDEKKDGAIVSRILARDVFDAGILSGEKLDASNGASAARAPHLYQTSNGADAVTISVLTEYTAQVTHADGHIEVMRRGYRMGEMVLNEYARNTLDGARVYRIVSLIGSNVTVETSTEYYHGASVTPLYKPTARRVKLATTRNGAFKPRKLSEQDTAYLFTRALLALFIETAHAHGTDGTHFACVPHVHNSATEEKEQRHDNEKRRKSMSGAQRRKLRKMRNAATA